MVPIGIVSLGCSSVMVFKPKREVDKGIALVTEASALVNLNHESPQH